MFSTRYFLKFMKSGGAAKYTVLWMGFGWEGWNYSCFYGWLNWSFSPLCRSWRTMFCGDLRGTGRSEGTDISESIALTSTPPPPTPPKISPPLPLLFFYSPALRRWSLNGTRLKQWSRQETNQDLQYGRLMMMMMMMIPVWTGLSCVI